MTDQPFDPTPATAPRPRRPAGWVVAVVAAVAALGALAAIGAATSSKDEPQPGAGGESDACGAVLEREVGAGFVHRDGPIEYDASPPAGGEHNPVTLPAFRSVIDRDAAPDLVVEKAVHNLEHGYVVVWYGTTTTDAQLDAMRDAVEEAGRRKVLVVPYPGAIEAPFVLTAWGHEQPCREADATALRAFWDAHGGKNGEAPEPDAP